MTTNLRLLTVVQVMARLNLPRSTVYKLIASGEVRTMKGVIGGGRTANLLVSEQSLIEWEQRRLQGQTPVEAPRALDADASLPPAKEPTFQ